MFPEALQDISRPNYLDIIGEIKMSGGLSVPQLAERLNMSYMGIKQHCINLEKKAYLRTWRLPRTKVGRPQKLYKLTSKCDALFPQVSSKVFLELLEGVQSTFGESSPEKLLYHFFEKQRDQWLKATRPGESLLEKTTRLVEARIKQGHITRCHYSKGHGLVIEEYHHPMHQILEKYPRIRVVEINMLEQVLGTNIQYSEDRGIQGVKCIIYAISTL